MTDLLLAISLLLTNIALLSHIWGHAAVLDEKGEGGGLPEERYPIREAIDAAMDAEAEEGERR